MGVRDGRSILDCVVRRGGGVNNNHFSGFFEVTACRVYITWSGRSWGGALVPGEFSADPPRAKVFWWHVTLPAAVTGSVTPEYYRVDMVSAVHAGEGQDRQTGLYAVRSMW